MKKRTALIVYAALLAYVPMFCAEYYYRQPARHDWTLTDNQVADILLNHYRTLGSNSLTGEVRFFYAPTLSTDKQQNFVFQAWEK